MVEFANPFLSIAGQKERLTNVVNVFKSIPSGSVKADVKNPVLKSTLEFVGNNPLTTAGLIAGGATGVLQKGVSSLWSGASTLVKAGTIATGSTIVGASIIEPKVAGTLVKGASYLTPESFARLGASSTNVIKNPSKESAMQLLTTSPTALLAGGALLLAGGATAGSTLATWQNTQATKDTNKLLSQFTSPSTEKEVEKASKQALKLEELKLKQTLELQKEQMEFEQQLAENQFRLAAKAQADELDFSNKMRELEYKTAKAQYKALKKAGATDQQANELVPITSTPYDTNEAVITTQVVPKATKKKTTTKKKSTKKKTTKKKTTKKKTTKKKKSLNTKRKKKK